MSPVLANLFMHYAFDTWMERTFPACPFERYADDGVVHCSSQAQAREVLAALAARMNEAGLELHPGKTRIVYCRDSSKEAVKRMSETVRSWRLHRHANLTWQQLAQWIGPVIRGWMSYYGRYYRSALYPLLARVNHYIGRWPRRKYRRLRPIQALARAWKRITAQNPNALPHWKWTTGVTW